VRLHSAATAITARHGGEVPRDHQALLDLPGVGTYTASAVTAFAHRQRIAVLDTNVRRVLARWRSGRAVPTASLQAGERQDLEALLPQDGETAAVTSEALMELGALVCTARNPRCEACPLADTCAWLAAGRPAAAQPSRRPPRYEGSDRQARGAILAALRNADGPLPIEAVQAVWRDPAQGARARESLERDGLLTVSDAGVSLPH
jgi:A/G-specific adenine glycosylase